MCLLGCVACAAAPPLPSEPVTVAVTHRLAAAADGASGQPVDNAPQTASKSVRLDIFALPTTPAIGSIEPRLLAVAAERGAPFRAASSLPPATRWASPPATLDGARLVGSATAVVAPGLETTFAPSAAKSLPAVVCTSVAPGVRLCLAMAAAPDRGTERAVLRDALTEAAAGMVFVPAADAALAGHALVITVLGAAVPSDLTTAEATARALAVAEALPGATVQQLGLAAAAVGEQPRRAAMLAVAAQLAVPACTDVLLAAGEPDLIAIGNQLADLDATRPDYAWTFARAVWTALVPGLQRDQLPPGLRAAVIRQLGAVAAEPSVLQLHLQASRDASAFATTLRQENVLALDDRDPVLRVQAHDWLAARGQAVAGFDPLAPEPARTEALRAHSRAESSR